MPHHVSYKDRARIIGMDCAPAIIVGVKRENGVCYYSLSGIDGMWPSWLVKLA